MTSVQLNVFLVRLGGRQDTVRGIIDGQPDNVRSSTDTPDDPKGGILFYFFDSILLIIFPPSRNKRKKSSGRNGRLACVCVDAINKNGIKRIKPQRTPSPELEHKKRKKTKKHIKIEVVVLDGRPLLGFRECEPHNVSASL